MRKGCRPGPLAINGGVKGKLNPWCEATTRPIAVRRSAADRLVKPHTFDKSDVLEESHQCGRSSRHPMESMEHEHDLAYGELRQSGGVAEAGAKVRSVMSWAPITESNWSCS